VSLGDFLAYPQAQTRPDVFLGGEERLEDPLKVLRSNPGTVVFYLKADRLTMGATAIFKVPLAGTASIAFEITLDISC
jgi:hypothetical protein